MTVDPRDMLILRLAEILRTRFTRQSHLALTVPWEGLGACTVRGCDPGCIDARAALAEAVAHLESVERGTMTTAQRSPAPLERPGDDTEE